MRCKDLLSPPEYSTVEAFLSWLAEKKPGKFDQARGVGTLLKEWNRLHHIIHLRTNVKFDKEKTEAMKKVF